MKTVLYLGLVFTGYLDMLLFSGFGFLNDLFIIQLLRQK